MTIVNQESRIDEERIEAAGRLFRVISTIFLIEKEILEKVKRRYVRKWLYQF